MDTDSSEEISKKLDKVLNGFLVQGCKLIDDVYLEMLITHLSGKAGERKIKKIKLFVLNKNDGPKLGFMDGCHFFVPDYAELKKSEFFRDWIGKAADQIEKDYRSTAQLCAFSLRLMSILFTDEWLFMNIIETDICLR